MAPVVSAMRASGLAVRIVASGQHRDLLHRALGAFGLRADLDLEVMREGQDLPDLTARLVDSISGALRSEPPRFALVHGDATTTMAAALACFYLKIPCGHVEAGLRSGNRYAPWPEEMNRRVTDQLCTHHYPPTRGALENLVREGVDTSHALVTGQTGVDAALLMAPRVGDAVPEEIAGLVDGNRSQLVYSTGHRRESFDGGIRSVAAALRAMVQERPECLVIFPAHPNPSVGGQLAEFVGAHERLHIIGPVSYGCSIWLMQHADAIVSDSGGIQEEAPSFGVPVLVTRAVTERPEGVEAGFLRIVGTRTDSVLQHLRSVLDDVRLKERLKTKPNPYGDGQASRRIAEDVTRILRELPRR